MTFWKCPHRPGKYALTEKNHAWLITYSDEQLRVLKRPLDAHYAGSIMNRYKLDNLDDHPTLKKIISLIL